MSLPQLRFPQHALSLRESAAGYRIVPFARSKKRLQSLVWWQGGAGMNETSSGGSVGGAELENLYKVLVQCFAIIASGYVTMRLGLVSASPWTRAIGEGKLEEWQVTEEAMGGIRTLILYLLTPAIIIKSLLHLGFGTINWLFLAILFLGKAAVFAVTAAVTLLLSDDFQKAG